ncbi:MAG: ABC transporter permease, partial [Candidatus Wolfebacteria bacterium]|nr:ABC transporter permease [Candidatus Wolfebacteria bacterium]
MEYAEIITEAISTLTVNKLRTGLATLGIVIGIGSVIALVSLGQASQQAVQSQIQSLGSNLLTVSPGSTSQGGIRGAAGGATTLTLADAEVISNSPQITTIEKVSPEYTSRTQITTGRTNTNTQVVGVTPTYAEIRNLTIASGNFISEQQVNSIAKVAVLGPTVVTNLFGEGANPIGQTIRINGQTLTIIGVTNSKGGTGFQNQDDIVWVPLSTAQKQLFGADHITSIALEAKNPDVMVEAQNEVGYLLLARHKLSDPAQADFSIFSQQDILGAASQITGTFTALLSGIAAISLLVGGIGIMNI